MIISASRRTDIPAFFSEWFINRVRAGFCEVPNPFNPRQISRVSLAPNDVEAIVFWSKNPRPLLCSLKELDDKGFRYYFHFTVNNYDQQIEPALPPLEERLQIFERLVEHVGPQRVIWRYDPIIISSKTSYAFHEQSFSSIAERLCKLTHRVMVSTVVFYQKTNRRLSKIESDVMRIDRQAASSSKMVDLLVSIREAGNRVGIEVLTCGMKELTGTGVKPGRCIDSELIRSIWSVGNLPAKKDPNQRKECGCVTSKDIGVCDTCVNECLYCYSTRNPELARNRYKEHNPNSPMLYGDSSEQVSSGSKQLSLF